MTGPQNTIGKMYIPTWMVRTVGLIKVGETTYRVCEDEQDRVWAFALDCEIPMPIFGPVSQSTWPACPMCEALLPYVMQRRAA